MNIHPFLVHFPIAFLSVYSLAELVRFRFITSRIYWFYIKASFAIIGALGAGVAYKTGKIARDLLGEGGLDQFVEIHSRWAKLSTVIFGFIAVLYALAWISRSETMGRIESHFKLGEIWIYTISKKAVNYLVNSAIMVVPAFVGLVSIVVTGALGGALVYGPDIDPFVRFIYDLILR